mmetsp:Transcript_32612/g.40420  ORF Transcript_32612/g.40420 Transcript_32612/m.40420 type:complete len:81 (-) Transcript_32612:137-379(-)
MQHIILQIKLLMHTVGHSLLIPRIPHRYIVCGSCSFAELSDLVGNFFPELSLYPGMLRLLCCAWALFWIENEAVGDEVQK